MTLEDDKQAVVHRLIGIKKFKEWHVFSDNVDGYQDDYKKALKAYKELCKKEDNVRLYENVYERIDGVDELVEENCLKAKGEYPT